MAKIGEKALSIFKISRFFVSSMAGLISLSTYLNTSNLISQENSIYLFIVVTFTSAFGFTLNDFFDREKDLLNHSHRMIPSKSLNLKEVIFLCVFLCFVSILFSFLLSFMALIFNVLIILLLFAYSYINNKFGFLANIITALISSFTIIYGMVIGEFKLFLLIVSVAAFFLILGREILLDIRDLLADRSINKSSIPINYGSKNAMRITTIFFLLYTILIIFASLFNSTGIGFFVFVTFLSNILIWYSFLKYLKTTSKKSLNKFFITSRLSFLLLVISLLI